MRLVQARQIADEPSHRDDFQTHDLGDDLEFHGLGP